MIGRVTGGKKREFGARQPSVILRAVHPGEDLWTVAKAYLTTDSDIMEASGLTSGEIFPGQMLLIPRKTAKGERPGTQCRGRFVWRFDGYWWQEADSCVFTDIVGGLFSQQGIGVRGLFQNGDHGVQGKRARAAGAGPLPAPRPP